MGTIIPLSIIKVIFMPMRNIIIINEEKCTGCGACVNGCPEGALKVIDGKARLVGELLCDGLGACMGNCPEGAMRVEKKDVEPYDEIKALENVAKQGKNVIKAHLEHLKSHQLENYYEIAQKWLREHGIFMELDSTKCGSDIHGCPGSRSVDLKQEQKQKLNTTSDQSSELTNWPIQIKLAPIQAPYFDKADLLIAADCVGASYPNFHRDFVKGKTLLIGCPKLDDAQFYIDKLTLILKANEIKSLQLGIMEVPCCGGLSYIVDQALTSAGKKGKIPVKTNVIGIKGKIIR